MGSFEVTRSVPVDVDPGRVHTLVNDFHEWTAWSPWEDVDPQLERVYSGPTSGVGARYAWQGNRKAGEGSMEITGSSPERIDIELTFLRPFANTNHVEFAITPVGTGSEVTWTMTGENKGLWSIVSKVFPMDKIVGKDFEKGLSRLKAVAEAP